MEFETVRRGQGYTVVKSPGTGLFYYIRHDNPHVLHGPYTDPYHAAEAYHMATVPPIIPIELVYTNNVVHVDFANKRRI